MADITWKALLLCGCFLVARLFCNGIITSNCTAACNAIAVIARLSVLIASDLSSLFVSFSHSAAPLEASYDESALA